MIELFFDGSCQPWNPGGVASYGFVLLREGKAVLEGKGVVGTPGTPESTNNVAEYTGLIRGLEALPAHITKAEKLEILGDSQLVLYQVAGRYAVNAAHLKPLHAKVSLLISDLRAKGHPVGTIWVPREKNAHADRLSNEAVQDHFKKDPAVLDETVLGFGKHKGAKWRDVPKDYKDWLFAKK